MGFDGPVDGKYPLGKATVAGGHEICPVVYARPVRGRNDAGHRMSDLGTWQADTYSRLVARQNAQHINPDAWGKQVPWEVEQASGNGHERRFFGRVHTMSSWGMVISSTTTKPACSAAIREPTFDFLMWAYIRSCWLASPARR
jgi:hypothetical protein